MIEAAGTAVDAEAQLRSVGLDPHDPLDVTQMLADHAYYDLLERLAAAMDNAHELPLLAGRLMRPNDYGALGLAWKSAPTIRQSLERVERYCRLWTDNMTYELRGTEGGAYFVLHREGSRRLGLRLSNEATLASAVSLVRQTGSPDFAPLAVYCKHEAPSPVTAHERYFQCPVHFGADQDALLMSDDALALPNELGDDGISAFLISHLDEELGRIEGHPPLEDLVQRAISAALSDGVPRMADVARRLGMSERTLHRRLSEEGITFQSIIEKSRQHLAQALLHQSRYSLAEVAFLTGFSEQSAFNRAFKRWAGTTPTAFRKQVSTPPA